MADATLAFDILARDRASKVFDKVGARSQTMGDRMDRVGKQMARAAGVVALGGIAALGVGLVKGVTAAARFEVLTSKTNAVIASTGNVANISTKGVQSLAASLESMSGVDEELIINSQNVLATFTNVRNEVGKGNDIFDQGAEAALNMSVALGTDLQGATIQIGKALQDPIRGITALRRAGVQLSEAQTEQIRVMVEAGDIMGAQKVILGELESQFGGVAEAAGDTFAGKLERAKDSLADMAREVGASLLPALGGIADWVANTGVPALRSFGRFVGELGAAFADLPGPVQAAGLAMAGVVASAPLAVSAYKKVKGAIDSVTTAYAAMGRAGKIASLSLGAIGLALAAGTTVLGFFAKAKADAAARVAAFTDAIEADSGALGENTQVALANEIAKEGIADAAERAGVSIETVAKAIAGDSTAMRSLEQRANSLGAEFDDLFSRQGTLTDAEVAHAAALQQQIGAISELIPKVDTQRDAFSDARAEYELSQEVLGATTGALGENQAATEGATSAIGEQVGELQALNEALTETYELLLTQRDAERGLEEAYDRATEAFKENGATLDITTEQGRANQNALDAIADSALGLTGRMLENGASQEQVQAKMEGARAAFISTARQMGLSEAAAGDLANQLGLIPGNYKATVTVADRATTALKGIRDWLAKIQSKTVTITARADIPAGVSIRQLMERQHGGPVRRGDVAIVGEEGPEIVRFTGDGEVIPHGKTMQILRGKGASGRQVAMAAEEPARPIAAAVDERALARAMAKAISGAVLVIDDRGRGHLLAKNADLYARAG